MFQVPPKKIYFISLCDLFLDASFDVMKLFYLGLFCIIHYIVIFPKIIRSILKLIYWMGIQNIPTEVALQFFDRPLEGWLPYDFFYVELHIWRTTWISWVLFMQWFPALSVKKINCDSGKISPWYWRYGDDKLSTFNLILYVSPDIQVLALIHHCTSSIIFTRFFLEWIQYNSFIFDVWSAYVCSFLWAPPNLFSTLFLFD